MLLLWITRRAFPPRFKFISTLQYSIEPKIQNLLRNHLVFIEHLVLLSFNSPEITSVLLRIVQDIINSSKETDLQFLPYETWQASWRDGTVTKNKLTSFYLQVINNQDQNTNVWFVVLTVMYFSTRKSFMVPSSIQEKAQTKSLLSKGWQCDSSALAAGYKGMHCPQRI